MFVICFFCKQKTADEMRISDWSSDVCSSDLVAAVAGIRGGPGAGRPDRRVLAERGRRPADGGRGRIVGTPAADDRTHPRCRHRHPPPLGRRRYRCRHQLIRSPTDPFRSEEHTSELQSLMRTSYAVFCLNKKMRTKSEPSY